MSAKRSKTMDAHGTSTMSTAVRKSSSQDEDLIKDTEKTEALAETQNTNEVASAHASVRTRSRIRADLGTGRGREKAQLSCNICRQRK